MYRIDDAPSHSTVLIAPKLERMIDAKEKAYGIRRLSRQYEVSFPYLKKEHVAISNPGSP